jgi:hypothetical protein
MSGCGNMTAGRRRHHRKTHKGGVYTQDVSKGIAGFPETTSIREIAGAAYDTRGGNNVPATGGRRRKHHRKSSHKKTAGRRHHRKTHRGGMYGTPVKSDLALNVPRAGYGYVGTGVAGFADPTPTY